MRFRDLSLIYAGMHGGLSSRRIALGFLGPGVRPEAAGAQRVPVIEDLAPTLLAAWGLETPTYMDGARLDVLR